MRFRHTLGRRYCRPAPWLPAASPLATLSCCCGSGGGDGGSGFAFPCCCASCRAPACWACPPCCSVCCCCCCCCLACASCCCCLPRWLALLTRDAELARTQASIFCVRRRSTHTANQAARRGRTQRIRQCARGTCSASGSTQGAHIQQIRQPAGGAHSASDSALEAHAARPAARKGHTLHTLDYSVRAPRAHAADQARQGRQRWTHRCRRTQQIRRGKAVSDGRTGAGARSRSGEARPSAMDAQVQRGTFAACRGTGKHVCRHSRWRWCDGRVPQWASSHMPSQGPLSPAQRRDVATPQRCAIHTHVRPQDPHICHQDPHTYACKICTYAIKIRTRTPHDLHICHQDPHICHQDPHTCHQDPLMPARLCARVICKQGVRPRHAVAHAAPRSREHTRTAAPAAASDTCHPPPYPHMQAQHDGAHASNMWPPAPKFIPSSSPAKLARRGGTLLAARAGPCAHGAHSCQAASLCMPTCALAALYAHLCCAVLCCMPTCAVLYAHLCPCGALAPPQLYLQAQHDGAEGRPARGLLRPARHQQRLPVRCQLWQRLAIPVGGACMRVRA